MIPRAHITAWRTSAPWPENEQVEQDLVLSRALVELFSDSMVVDGLAFRGGTALNKLFVGPPCRYSEDIDLVQLRAGPIGPLMDAIRERLDPWLGTPPYERSHGRVTLYYRYQSTFEPVQRMRLKVEITTREHFSVRGIVRHVFEVRSRWFSGSAPISTYQLEELLGTKLRALYQRRNGRDLFDLWNAQRRTAVDAGRVVECFQGRHVAGVYPLLEDETCWFLAVDFDKGPWRRDVVAFTETCRNLGVPVAVERSRSGNGAHGWFFFSEAVAASDARKMGCYLITETMARRHEVPMSSYDRLFPNQDTMPRGGFGNLIALPFQDGPRQQGNTSFGPWSFALRFSQRALMYTRYSTPGN
ncbi:MAG: hypothetical protein BMS9Abin01_0483 [Gammaproteobacteria bacterium]|nr:MAG: hypothetical protein BMS9Abin01_0483 [Gammaproteobacteria bacterium]